jgi:hypothetical protein
MKVLEKGSSFRAFQILDSHYKAGKLSGGVENPFTCIKKHLIFFLWVVTWQGPSFGSRHLQLGELSPKYT